MLQVLREIVRTGGPFAPAPMGHWIRTLTFRHYFEKKLRHHPIRRVLDAGCGDGSYALELATKIPGAEVVGLDLLRSPRWRELTLPNLSFREGDLRHLDERDAFDLIVSIDSLEHIANNRVVMHAFWRALRPGGLLYIAMPRDDDDATFLPHAWFADHNEWAEHEHVGEQYDLEGLVTALRAEGFSIDFARHTFTVWGRLSWEFYTVLNRNRLAFRMRALGMPLFKLLGIMDLHLPIGGGHNLVIARKTASGSTPQRMT